MFVLSGKEEDITKLDKNLKSAFTRKYNKMQKRFATSAKGKKQGKQRVVDDDVGFLMEENLEEEKEREEEEEDDAKDLEKDSMIKKKVASKKTDAEPKTKKRKK